MSKLFMFAAFSIDVGYIVVATAELQNAADAAAMAGARQLSQGPAQARAAAINLAAQNQAAGAAVALNTTDIEIGTWSEDNASFTLLAAEHETTGDAVRVRVTRSTAGGNPLSLFIAGVLGRHVADIRATAIARARPSRCGMFIGISKVTLSGGSYTDSYSSASGAYQAATAGYQGHVCSDGAIALSSSWWRRTCRHGLGAAGRHRR